MNSTNNIIEVKNVKKFFKVYYDRGITLKDKIITKGRNKYEKREVLKGVSFNVKRGEAIGLIGKNGCGKSTTLKLLTRIIYPNEGNIEIQGRVSSLLELGAGFHQDMSGKENIYMNAAVFGLTRKEIDKRVDDIIEFSELGEFIDNPVRTYSSGMYMRLAFSVAINVDADVLLIDEILAVGDISFQKKCFEKLKEIKRKGTTIVIVSHSLDQIERICDRTIWIENGLIKEEGKPREVHEKYLYDMEKERLGKVEQIYLEEVQCLLDEKSIDERVVEDKDDYDCEEDKIDEDIEIIEDEEVTLNVNESNERDTEKSKLEEIDVDYNEQLKLLNFNQDKFWMLLEELSRYKIEVFDIPSKAENIEYYYDNPAIGGIDAIMYYYMIRHFKPKRLVEVGAGFSTLLAGKACQKNECTNFVSIEPYPMDFVRKGIAGLDELKVEKLQDIPLEFFEELEENDILFIDSSHVLKAGSDVVYIFTMILPRLKKGIIVHFHDMFIPYEVPEKWTKDELLFWNEQYVLYSILVNATDEYDTLMPNYYLGTEHRDKLLTYFPEMPEYSGYDDVSYWIRKKK